MVPPGALAEGKPEATVVRVPFESIFEILALGPPV
jgi:hypothetical protein